MRFKANRPLKPQLTIAERNIQIRQEREKKINWHPWFAWHPVRIEDEYVWWEHVERSYPNARYGTQLVPGSPIRSTVWRWYDPVYRLPA